MRDTDKKAGADEARRIDASDVKLETGRSFDQSRNSSRRVEEL